MGYNRDVHRRRSIRLRGFDYSGSGAYFITVCTHQRQPLFGHIADGIMVLNAAGEMVESVWRELVNKFPGIRLHEFVTMPNHIHGVIEIMQPVGADLCVCPELCVCPDGANAYKGECKGSHTGAPLPEIVQWFKTMTTNACIRGVKHDGWRPFAGRVWQRNYYEHVIRDQRAYLHIAGYIRSNPLQWPADRYHIDTAPDYF